MRVRIVRDTCSPLWVVRCATPCDDMPPGKKGCQGLDRDPSGPGLCWLGSGGTQQGAERYARSLGHEVANADRR